MFEVLSHFMGIMLIAWIPAFAGMTKWWVSPTVAFFSKAVFNYGKLNSRMASRFIRRESSYPTMAFIQTDQFPVCAGMAVAGVRKLASPQQGFTYLVVLLVIAIMGAGLALTGTVWHTEVRREKETELLFIGGEFRHAIKQYYQAGGQYPKRLEDLLKDPRQPATVRYLRKIYPDPITGKKDWGFARGPDNGIIAVYSLSDDAPLKSAGFALADKDFEGKTKYSEWQFVALPAAAK